jgi:hypothetical protein
VTDEHIFSVGIAGHRPDRLRHADEARLADRLRTVLRAARDAAHERSATVRAISPLAEGADRLFADLAIDLGYELWCPMPFAAADYETDFMPPRAQEAGSRLRFEAILDRARARTRLETQELNGTRADEGHAYADAGRAVVDGSDLLVAVWDGEPAAGPGGTNDTLDAAIDAGVPVLWINAAAPHSWRVVRAAGDLSRGDATRMSADDESLAEAVRTLVARALSGRRERG